MFFSGRGTEESKTAVEKSTLKNVNKPLINLLWNKILSNVCEIVDRTIIVQNTKAGSELQHRASKIYPGVALCV
jgi:wyosine [tRNA(Phe)-imidazoG37] synthetase (radical SAM superfamily)